MEQQEVKKSWVAQVHLERSAGLKYIMIYRIKNCRAFASINHMNVLFWFCKKPKCKEKVLLKSMHLILSIVNRYICDLTFQSFRARYLCSVSLKKQTSNKTPKKLINGISVWNVVKRRSLIATESRIFLLVILRQEVHEALQL